MLKAIREGLAEAGAKRKTLCERSTDNKEVRRGDGKRPRKNGFPGRGNDWKTSAVTMSIQLFKLGGNRRWGGGVGEGMMFMAGRGEIEE